MKHGIDTSEVYYGVLAGTVGEFKQWQRRHEIPLGASVFISTTEVLHSVFRSYPNVTFHIVGMFNERPDATELLRIIRERQPDIMIYTDR